MSTYVIRTASSATYVLDLGAMRLTRLSDRPGIGLTRPAESFDLHGWHISGGRLEVWVVSDDESKRGSITSTTVLHVVCPDGTILDRPQNHGLPALIGA
jgi:hypothetical protein